MQGISPETKNDQEIPPEPRSTVVFMTIVDTTWRMFVPSIGLTLLGAWLDSRLQTAPWLLLAGSIFGLIIAALAVSMQLKKIW